MQLLAHMMKPPQPVFMPPPPQVPAAQVWPFMQAWPHMPQFCGSVCVEVQTLLHITWPFIQPPPEQVLFEQLMPFGQTLPQLPQLLLSVARLVQPVPQLTRPPMQPPPSAPPPMSRWMVFLLPPPPQPTKAKIPNKANARDMSSSNCPGICCPAAPHTTGLS